MTLVPSHWCLYRKRRIYKETILGITHLEDQMRNWGEDTICKPRGENLRKASPAQPCPWITRLPNWGQFLIDKHQTWPFCQDNSRRLIHMAFPIFMVSKNNHFSLPVAPLHLNSADSIKECIDYQLTLWTALTNEKCQEGFACQFQTAGQEILLTFPKTGQGNVPNSHLSVNLTESLYTSQLQPTKTANQMFVGSYKSLVTYSCCAAKPASMLQI